MLKDKISENLIYEIEHERINQHTQWGGPNHDDTHSKSDWTKFISKQCAMAEITENHVDFKNRMVKVVALAIAAIESSSRKDKREKRGALV